MTFESLDALYSLDVEKKAGKSSGSPLFGELMFYDQQHVDQFVAQYAAPTSNTQVRIAFVTFLYINILL